MVGLRGAAVVVADGGPASEPEGVPVVLTFRDGTRFRAEHWQVIEARHEGFGSRHRHCQCCMPVPVDPVDQLRDVLGDCAVVDVRRDADEVLISFEGGVALWLKVTSSLARFR